MLKILNSRITNNPITGFDRYKKILIANKVITKDINYPSKIKGSGFISVPLYSLTVSGP